jgi:hypothetical protein
MALQLPAWLETLPETEREDARRRFLLRLAALYDCPEGHMKHLSEGIGLAPNTLATYLSQSQPITPEIAVKLETRLGKDLFPRSVFRPDIFSCES